MPTIGNISIGGNGEWDGMAMRGGVGGGGICGGWCSGNGVDGNGVEGE